MNESNIGFAAGNNVGIKAAKGEYIILLNNDTYLTHGWIRGLIRPMQLNSEIGLVGPLTNNIGNEQQIRIAYRNMQEMEVAAHRFVRSRLRQTILVRRLAFFAVALRRRTIDLVGLLDERYGLGYFEDDDYCMRANEQGVKMVIADDVFIHHHLSVSFSTLGAQAGELMKKNRALFEERWGAWEPHRYRDEPGFG
jgi:GT2 family glycosyltransferase